MMANRNTEWSDDEDPWKFPDSKGEGGPQGPDHDPWDNPGGTSSREEPRSHASDPHPGYSQWQRMSVEELTGRQCSPSAPPEKEPVTAWLRRNLENAGVRQDIASDMARSMYAQDPTWGRVWYAIAGGWQPTGPQGRAAVTAAVWMANEALDGSDWDMWDRQAPFEM